ncbi:hypothetical protein QN277_005987 [Acacia crassicarpa]|uniref:MATH domain-containing protein n=1 Tax=Acacia crassicarpa TaxID=499986 RepID=A0AAE1J0U4_9FABA|nr:hypothetical protein QN277_005987 [Acacia crassicarpa]
MIVVSLELSFLSYKELDDERVKSRTPAENSYKFTWKLHNFSTISNPVRSQVFTTLEDENIKWSFAVGYVPMGSDTSRNYDDEYLSLYLVWEHKDRICICQLLPNCLQISLYASKIKWMIPHIKRHGSHWFGPGDLEYFGWEQFATVREVQRCISDNTLIIECDIDDLRQIVKLRSLD